MALTVEPVPATAANAAVARWVETALRESDRSHVAGVVPATLYEATVAVRHPAWACECDQDNVPAIHAGHDAGAQPIAWDDAVAAGLPVVYGMGTGEMINGAQIVVGTQYRRLDDGWIVDTLPVGGLNLLIRPGDRWIGGPTEGSLGAVLAEDIRDILERATTTPGSCWFGLWDGFGFVDADAGIASLRSGDRRWQLYRGAVQNMVGSFEPQGHWRQSPNLVWPADRAWCLATEIDAEVTLVAGPDELIQAILAVPLLDTQEVAPDSPLMRFGELLNPIVERPPEVEIDPAFESREPPLALQEMMAKIKP